MWPARRERRAEHPEAEKEAIRRQGLFNEDGDLATPFRRLKLVMDYWCALWFWPIQESATLPSREQWWMEVGAVLEGNIVDVAPQAEMDFAPEPAEQVLVPKSQLTLDGFESQLRLAANGTEPACTTDSASCGSAGCASIFRAWRRWRRLRPAAGSCTGSCVLPTFWRAVAASTCAGKPAMDQGGVERGGHPGREEPAVRHPQDQRVGA